MIPILILATGLRLVLLNQSLWLDESIQAIILMLRKVSILEYSVTDFQPPLYHFVLDYWTKIAGFSEIALRTPSLIAGILSVVVIIKLGRVIHSSKVGLTAGLLLATNPLHIYYSQEGRTYALTTFLILCSYYFLIRLTAHPKSNKLKFEYFLSTSLALWTSYVGWISILLQFLYLTTRKNKLALITLLSTLTLLPWLPHFFRQLAIGQSTLLTSPEWGRVVGGFDLKSLPLTWVKFIIGRVSFANKTYYALAASIVMLFHSYIFSKSRHRKHTLLYTWLVGSISLAIIISVFVPVYQYFRVLFVLPAYLLLLSYGLSKLPSSYTRYAVILHLLSLMFFWQNDNFHREDWRSASNYIKEVSTGKSALALPSRNQGAPLEYYLPNMQIIEPKSAKPINFDTVYYFDYVEDIFDKDQVGKQSLTEQHFNVKDEKTFPGLHLMVYQR